MEGIWIRSQDRETLIFATCVKVNDYSSSVTASNGDKTLFVGTYATRKRCVEVADEIEDKIGYLNDTEIRTPAYHMPQE
jgi:hypothetical protein